MNIWWLMVVCGVITFGIRYSFIAAEGHFQPPGWFHRLLPFVPVGRLGTQDPQIGDERIDRCGHVKAHPPAGPKAGDTNEYGHTSIELEG